MLIPFGWLASAGGAAGAYELISTTVLGTTASSVTFTNGGAWAGYKHLQIRATLKNSGSNTDTLMRINADSGANYSSHYLMGYNSTMYSGSSVSASSMLVGMASPSTETNVYGSMVLDLLDFSGTKNKTVRALTGLGGTISLVSMRSGAWYSTAAVTSLTLLPSANLFAANCRFSLYGIKG